MIVSYHNHTDWSDGKATIAEQIAAARALGLDELGISDHYVLHPVMPIDWSIPLDRFAEYVEAVRCEAAANPNITLRIGVEADYFPETVDSLRDMLARFPLDYVIGSVHYVGPFPVDEKAALWEAVSEDELNELWRQYWQLITEMAQSGVYDFAAHLDLPKKFGHRSSADLTREAHVALDSIVTAGMAIEINTAGWSLPAGEAYPSLVLLKAARKRDIPLLINADAHRAGHLTRDFERARELARAAGYTELVRYEKRQRYPIPL